jgi:hypothetical protein
MLDLASDHWLLASGFLTQFTGCREWKNIAPNELKSVGSYLIFAIG